MAENKNTNKGDKKPLVLKQEHAKATLEYKGEQISLEFASPEILQDLFENPIWKYLFEI